MAFLDNSGDIILDAVLTDTGRMRLAKGDGTFKITKFALGDDEINYNNYNSNHASGSAYYDLTVLQTPVLEAFTNNTSLMKSKLLSIPRTNLLYLPVLLLNRSMIGTRRNNTFGKAEGTHYIVTVDERTSRTTLSNADNPQPGLIPAIVDNDQDGVMNGFEPGVDEKVYIRIDQGLNTDEIHPKHRLSSDLIETQYIIEMDNRLGTIVTAGDISSMPGQAGTPAAVSFIDDDNIASYFLSLGTDPGFVKDITGWTKPATTSLENSQLKGPRGTSLRFKVAASTELQTSNFLFQRLGTTSFTTWTLPTTSNGGAGNATVHYIDSTIRITGATTGYRIDIPVRFAKRVD